MRFFVSEEERKISGSTSFIEFQKGRYENECWRIDSICMDESVFYDLHLRRFFTLMLPQFDYFGITQVSAEDFNKIKESAGEFSGEVAACIKELADWAEKEADAEVLFTIIGL